jgi:hypothetical protein
MSWQNVISSTMGLDLGPEIAVIQAIPDGIRLDDFPCHLDGPQCWCRPQAIFVADEVLFAHKDLSRGEFDC